MLLVDLFAFKDFASLWLRLLKTKKASFRDESERGLISKPISVRTHLFPSHNFLCAEQDVAPFPAHKFYVQDGCQGFKGPDPSTFRNENATNVKERMSFNPTKKPFWVAFKRALLKSYLYSIALMSASCTYTCNTSLGKNW